MLEQHELAHTSDALLVPREFGLLVVDDERSVRRVLSSWMRESGFVVWLASNGDEALDLYRRHSAAIDVVLLDVRLPGRDGPQTLAALRQLNPDVRCRFMSGGYGTYTETELRDLSAGAVLPKPFRLDEVSRTMRELASHANGGPPNP